MNFPLPTLSIPPSKLPYQHEQSIIIHATVLRDFLIDHLDSTWMVYLCPFLNGDYPPVAAFHPIHGLTIFGVYPWDLRSYRQEQRGRYLRYFQRGVNGVHPIQSPVRRVEHQVEDLINLYLPHIGESVGRDRRCLQSFQIALYFPHATTHAAQIFAPIAPGRGTVFGYDAVEAADLTQILPASQRPSNRAMPQEWIEDIRYWLDPPHHLPRVGTVALALTDEQRRHVEPAPGQHQRLHGVAGSGKTVVIAQRAANLAAAGKRVLVITFNVTLWQYIRKLVDQSNVRFDWRNIEFHHFHGFCRTFLSECGVEWPRPHGRPPQQAIDELVPRLIAETVEKIRTSESRTMRCYDAILIDEGQDFSRLYYDMLCHFLTENNELLLVADRKQNLYLRDDSWLEKMSGTRFRGRWRELKHSYRLAPNIAYEANRFAALFLSEAVMVTPSLPASAVALQQPLAYSSPGHSSLANSYLGWHNMKSLADIITMIRHTLPWLLNERRLKPADIAILAPNHADGWTVASSLANEGMAVNHILNEDDGQIGRKQRRFRKRTFAPEDERIKVSTIHSFKGWELQTVIVITPPNEQFWEAQCPYLFYVAMTRARQNLIVFNRFPAYNAYGATWNELYYDPTAPTHILPTTETKRAATHAATGFQPNDPSDSKDY